MKIAQLLGSLNRGGTETLLLDVVTNIKEFGNLDIILIHRKKGDLYPNFQQSEVVLHKLTSNGDKFTYIRKLRRLLTENKIEIVHSHQPLDAFYAYLACLGTNIKIVLTFHGYDYGNGKMASLITNFIIHRTNSNIFVSDYVKKYYTDKYQLKNRSITLYNGVGQKKSTSKIDTNLRTDFFINKSSLIIGMVGNFVQVRDPLTICRFLNLVKLKGIEFHFFFIGAKNEQEPYRYDECYIYCQENNLSNNVTFLGSRNDVPSILKQLDAFIYSTAHDTFGIAVVEAMMAGIPVFVNDWEVMNEITENGKYAHVYQSKNEEDLLIKFKDFLDNRNVYKQKAIENAEIIKEKYSIHKHLLGLQKIYHDLIKTNA